MSCGKSFQCALPSSFAEMADGSTAYGPATCGEFFYPQEDVVLCPSCQAELDEAQQELIDQEIEYLESLGPGGEDAPQMGNPEYYRGF